MYCCIAGCCNTSKNNSKGVKFYYFPTNSTHMPWLRDKRIKWINAVVKHTRHPNKWLPSKNTTVCSAHFIGNKKSENPLHPSYLPTIFPGEENRKNLDQKIERFARHQHRMQRAGSVKEEKSYNRSVSRENQGLQEAAPTTVNEELDTSATAEVQQSLNKSPGPVEEEADNEVAGEVQGLQDTSSPGPVDEEPDAPVEVKEVCRICLAFNVKMYNIQEHNLCQMLYDITGIKVGESDGIFQYVCYECAARLSAASAFRHKALKSEGMLQRLMNCGDTIAEQITFLKENLDILKPTLTVQEVFITTDIAEEPNIKFNLIDDKAVETTHVVIKEKYKDIVKTFCDVETIDNFVPTERSLTMHEDGSVTICKNIKEHESTTLHGQEDNSTAITKEELTRRVKERLKELKFCNVPDLAKEFGVTTELVQKIIDDAGLKKGYKRKKGSPQNQRGAGKKSKVS